MNTTSQSDSFLFLRAGCFFQWDNYYLDMMCNYHLTSTKTEMQRHAVNSRYTPFCTERSNNVSDKNKNSLCVCLFVICRFYTRWKEWESWYSQSFGLHFSLREEQWQEDWAFILSLASQVHATWKQQHTLLWRTGRLMCLKRDTLMMYELCKQL